MRCTVSIVDTTTRTVLFNQVRTTDIGVRAVLENFTDMTTPEVRSVYDLLHIVGEISYEPLPRSTRRYSIQAKIVEK